MNTKLVYHLLIIMLLSISFSCNESAKEKQQRETIDSLRYENMQGQMDYEDLQQYLTIIADGLDSISIEEGEIFINTPGESLANNKQRMKQQLEHVRELLSRHRDRIDELERLLATQQGDAKKLHTIVVSLRQQLDQKDQELAQLKSDLDNSRKNITALRNTVTQMQNVQETQEQTIQDQQATIQEQQATIDTQAEQMYRAYIKIGTKNELKNEGLLSGGFLKKTKVDYSKIDLSTFQSIDTRTTNTISLPKKYKIMTTVPKNSYKVEKTGNGNTLYILNPQLFWSVSNFLIIQID